ncbi:hypothetical protein SAMN06295885_3353 [Rathayibacter oskolensis]|uniref:Uncharacterized protein n=1 Tax=Rathayibacter oskolensis TaxID=1891671 RepID=A0A1X7PEE1_9MICO|nr:hypothetical protein [Rathayibacter oskolensis]SMH49544.1 hypothetical protein SAMN06295885_3353 [Rathayibacter oskolensis]
MGLFSRKAPRSPEAPPAPVDTPREERVSLRDPGLSEDDPRQLLYLFCESMGVSFVLSADLPVETLLATAARTAPILTQSTHQRLGFHRLDADSSVFWTAIEGDGSSAVIVFCGPESNSSTTTKAIAMPFGAVGAPYSSDMIFRGSTEPSVRALIESAHVVPAWTEPAFARLRGVDGGFPTLPVTTRRAVSSWERLQPELYKRTFVDFEGDPMDVFAGLWDGAPLLIATVGQSTDGDLRPYEWVARIDGTSLLWLEPGVAATTPVPRETTPARLVEQAQGFVDSITRAYRDQVESLGAESVDSAAPRSLWDALETAPAPTAVPARPVPRPAPGRFHFTERFRELLPSDQVTFEALDRLARSLRTARGNGFEHSWRSQSDRPLLPSTVTVKSAVVDEPSGRFVTVGHLTHENWGMPPAHDLGAIDGRNAFTFPEAGHPGGLRYPTGRVYAGSSVTGATSVIDATLDVGSVDYHAATETIAVLGFLGSSTGAIHLYDRSGRRRLATVLEGYSGGEPLRFSGDGRWLLVSGSRSTRLVEVATGRTLEIEVGNAGWWPGANSTLLVVEHRDGAAVPRLYDVNAAEFVGDFAPLQADVVVNPEFPYFWFPAVSPDGSEMLTLSPAGVDAAHQHEHGSGHHLFLTDLSDGRTRLVHDVFADDAHLLERDVREVRWTAPDSSGLDPAPSVLAALRDPVTEHEYLAAGRWGEENEQFVIALLNQAIEDAQTGADPSALVPDILAALAAAASDEEVWARQSEWLTGLAAATAAAVVNGSVVGRSAEAWRRIGAAVRAAADRRVDGIDPVSAAWID